MYNIIIFYYYKYYYLFIIIYYFSVLVIVKTTVKFFQMTGSCHSHLCPGLTRASPQASCLFPVPFPFRASLSIAA